jgi:hypothetical protein
MGTLDHEEFFNDFLNSDHESWKTMSKNLELIICKFLGLPRGYGNRYTKMFSRYRNIIGEKCLQKVWAKGITLESLINYDKDENLLQPSSRLLVIAGLWAHDKQVRTLEEENEELKQRLDVLHTNLMDQNRIMSKSLKELSRLSQRQTKLENIIKIICSVMLFFLYLVFFY